MQAEVGKAARGRQLWQRFRAYWLAKHTISPLLMTAFFIGYFTLQNHPIFEVTSMPLTWLDRMIGFEPASLIFYASLWFYVVLVPVFIGDRRELIGYALSVTGLGLLGLSFFLLWPTSTPPADIDWSKVPSFAFLKAVDKAGNACPSLHVAFALFTGATADRLLNELSAGRVSRALNWLWCIGIIYSTMATKQHVAIDVLGGLALGSAWSVLHLRWVPQGHAGVAAPAPERTAESAA